MTGVDRARNMQRAMAIRSRSSMHRIKATNVRVEPSVYFCDEGRGEGQARLTKQDSCGGAPLRSAG